MRVAIIGQQAFGKAALEAFLGAGHEVVHVFTPPPEPGARPDALAAATIERGLVSSTPLRYGAPEAREALRASGAELAVMAYVTRFVPQSFCRIPAHGTIQFHPSLLPAHRGPSSINWPIMLGRRKTGLSIFRPVDGLDEGPVLLQKEVEILPDDTLGSVYFDKIFPLGVEALLEATELVRQGEDRAMLQDETKASYEGWVGDAESRIDWARHIDPLYDLIRGCNPAPGAWTSDRGRKLYLFDCAKRPAGTFGEVRGLALGQVVDVGTSGFKVHAQGGFIKVKRVRYEDGAKMAAGECGIKEGTILGA
ncbi:MAG TPA: methionyl-tRNA formyltransferase [Stellaceae bacterium]|nr:methionyl-tRNA formyltransferase [Stellaceae bacterium]